MKKNRNKNLLVLGGIGLLLPLIGTAFAASITINSGNDIEFGQGTEDVAACTSSAQIAFSSALSSGSLYVSEINISSINASCDGKYLRATVLNSIGASIDKIVWQISKGSQSSPTSFTLKADGTSTTSNHSFGTTTVINYPLNEASGSNGLDNSLLSANVEDVLLETSSSTFSE